LEKALKIFKAHPFFVLTGTELAVGIGHCRSSIWSQFPAWVQHRSCQCGKEGKGAAAAVRLVLSYKSQNPYWILTFSRYGFFFRGVEGREFRASQF